MDASILSLYDRIRGWEERARRAPVTPRLSREALAERLRPYDFSAPRDLAELVSNVADLLEQGIIQNNHPRYFGLFNAGTRRAGVVADALVALYNPQNAASWHSPAACGIEDHTLGYLARKIARASFDPTSSTTAHRFATFTSGGSEANLTGVLSALAHAFPRYGEEGIAAVGAQPVFYGSDQAHDSFIKIARMTGLGARAFCRVRSDDRQRMDVDALRAAIARDRAEGKTPFLVAATVGTTATGAIDPLRDLAALCKSEGLWLHADAAWGGIALFSDSLRPHVAGLAETDSITWDAHKTLPVPMGAGMFFSRTSAPSDALFSVRAGYVPEIEPGTPDLYQRSVQWSRRFIGLKIFMTLAELGDLGMAAIVEHQAQMGRYLREALGARGFRVMNDSPLPIACFTREGGPEVRPADVARRVSDEGTAWLSDVRLPNGQHWLRACITHHDTQREDIDRLVSAVQSACSEVSG
ncbi:pyridoxal phosphate-dependent decarboxylase family protein [Pendulispora albinea]|uniref:Aminotransferase class I/II-fold pyridoxal phosphate-dependent enzyme n=1 Tax=Pendulispora albinea TaxID=2741071 RepID=A0ABZ2LSJ3_9BACT